MVVPSHFGVVDVQPQATAIDMLQIQRWVAMPARGSHRRWRRQVGLWVAQRIRIRIGSHALGERCHRAGRRRVVGRGHIRRARARSARRRLVRIGRCMRPWTRVSRRAIRV